MSNLDKIIKTSIKGVLSGAILLQASAVNAFEEVKQAYQEYIEHNQLSDLYRNVIEKGVCQYKFENNIMLPCIYFVRYESMDIDIEPMRFTGASYRF